MPHDTPQEVSLRRVLDVARRRKLMLVSPPLLAGALATLYALSTPDLYRSKAILVVEPMGAKNIVSPPAYESPTAMLDRLRGIREILFSRGLLEQAGRQLRVADPAKLSSDATLEDIKSRISVVVEGNDSFSIGWEGEGREATRDTANGLARLFVEHTAQVHTQRAAEASGFLDQELEGLRARLLEQEQQIGAYKQKSVPELPEHVAANLKVFETLLGRSQTVRETLANEQARRAGLMREIRELERQGVNAPQEQPGSARAEEHLSRIEEQRLKVRQLQARYTERHPELAQAEQELRDLEKAPPRAASTAGKSRPEPNPARLRYLQVTAEREALDQRIDSYRREEQRLSAEIGGYQRRIAAAPQHETALGALMREYEGTRTQYQSLLQKQQEARLAERMERANQGLVFRISEPAPLPAGPPVPRRARIVLLGLAGGLGLGVVMAFVTEHLSSSFITAEEFQSYSELPVLAVIPDSPAQGRFVRTGRDLPVAQLDGETAVARQAAPQRIVVTAIAPQSLAAEQYNVLAWKVAAQLRERGKKSLLVTSAMGGDGKTVTALNLAIALSRMDIGRVLLVDADLRRPSVHRYLGWGLAEGFSDLLQKPEDRLGPYLSEFHGLWVLPGSRRRLIPVSALSSRSVGRVLERLSGVFDLIVVDAPPVLPLADSHLLAELTGCVLMVLRAAQTPREAWDSAMASLTPENLLGVVLNAVNLAHTGHARAYQYYETNYMVRS
jgi:polysaccharide chain length determinant protein (PEP-CTERM system associated)